MNDSDFGEIIRKIWTEHRERNIATRALGPDPVSYAWAIIQAWECYKQQQSSSESQ